MSDKKSIEKIFSDALGKAGAQPPGDTEDAIRKKLIEAGLLKEEPSKKRFFFWLWCISGLVILSVITGYFLHDDGKNAAQTTLQPEQKPSASTTSEQQNNTYLQGDSLSSSASETQTAVSENRMASDANTKSSAVDGENVKEDAKNIAGNSKGNKAANAGRKVKPGETWAKDASFAADNAKAEPEENSSSGAQGDRNAGLGAAAQTKQDTLQTENSNKKTAGEPGDSSVITANNIASQNTDSVIAEEKKNNLPPDSLSQEKSKKRFSIDIFGGPQINSFKYQSSNADFQPLADSSKKSESEKTSFAAGLGVNIPFKNFFLQPGISYSLIKSDFSKMLSDSSGGHYTYIDTTIYIYDSSHVVIDTVKIRDSSWVNNIFIHSAANKISVFEIPLWVGYKFSSGKFDIELKAGASVSFITSVNTTLLNPYSYAVVLYDDRKNSPYRKNYFSLLAAVNLVYNINDKFSLFLQPALKYGLGSIFNSDYPVSKKIQSYSLGAGLRINF